MTGRALMEDAKTDLVPMRCPPNSCPRILLVDDDDTIREVGIRILTRSGYQVDVAEDGAAGWDALHARRYDLLITDHNMPKLPGVELVKKLRRARMTVPVILASGLLPTEELKRHPWLQLAATLVKPFTVEELLQTVKDVLSAATTTVPLRIPVPVETVVPIRSYAQRRSQSPSGTDV